MYTNKKFNKKGFTLVELVVVIAVIAILAAIMIPMFINITKRANLSVDQQAVHEMNLALTMDEVDNGKQRDVESMISHMDKEGYNFSNYHPLTSGHDYFWNKDINRVVLVDLSKPEIIYPDEYKEDITTNDLVTEKEDIATATAVYFSLSMITSPNISADIEWTEIPTEKVTISDSGVITDIDASGITELRIPTTINNVVVTAIGSSSDSSGNANIFQNAGGVKSLLIDTNAKIEQNSLNGFTSLEYVEFTDKVTTMSYNDLFSNCKSTLKEVVIGENLTYVNGSLFADCTALEKVTVKGGAFGTSYVSGGTIGQGDSIFKGCTSLTTVILEEGVTAIPAHAFQGCTALTEVVIPSSVEIIGKEAFLGCDKLGSVTFKNVNGWAVYTYYTSSSSGNKTDINSATIEKSADAAKLLVYNPSEGFASRIWVRSDS